jgi:hypothetical protein
MPSTYGYPLDPSGNPSSPIAFRSILPWLLSADLPELQSGSLLRYNVTYSPFWIVFPSGAALRHVRVDGAVNGWIVERSAAPGRAIVLELRSCIAAAAELFACSILLLWAIAARRRTRSGSSA